jgi:hypothetical protein
VLPWQVDLAATVYASEAAYLKSAAGESLDEGDILSDVVITLSGYIPEGATVVAYLVPPEDLPDALDVVNVLCAYDITIYTSNGVEFQPEGDDFISVCIEAPEQLKDVLSDDVSVSHVDENDSGEPTVESVDVSDVSEGSVTFAAPRFSIYIVSTSTTAATEAGSYLTTPGSSIKLESNASSTSNSNWSVQKKDTNSQYSNNNELTLSNTGNSSTTTVTIPSTVTVGSVYRVVHTKTGSGSYTEYFYITIVRPLTISSATTTLAIGGNVTLGATATVNGNPVTLPVSHGRLPIRCRQVDTSGKVTGIYTGTATITATCTYEGTIFSGTATITVSNSFATVNTVDSSEYITLKMYDFSSAQKSAMDTAIGTAGGWTVGGYSGRTKTGLVSRWLSSNGCPTKTNTELPFHLVLNG